MLQLRVVAALTLSALLASCNAPIAPLGDGGDVDLGCRSDAQCSDGVFCNGEERCVAGGCLAPLARACADAGMCNEQMRTCGDPCVDRDGDGTCAAEDCDDTNAELHPGAVERCDAVDQDCDPSTLGPDTDRDGFIATRCCNPQPSGAPQCGDDCDDGSPDVRPTAPESCNQVDDDCDGMIDEGVQQTYYRDEDMDGFGGASGETRAGCTPPVGFVATLGDCDDTRSTFEPGGTDSCTVAGDDNCDGVADEGCACAAGSMRDCGPVMQNGVGICRQGTQTCIAGQWESACAGAVEPTSETCNQRDDDCDGMVDDGVCVPCGAGYSGIDRACVDIDECALGTSNCHPLQTCTNTAGSYRCGACPSGFTMPQPNNCQDINECLLPRAMGGCDPIVQCQNTIGSRVCAACPVGYTGTGDTGCVDVNECATNNGGCAAGTTCMNLPGGRSCGACPIGYQDLDPGPGSNCVDVDECATGASCGPNALRCVNTPGSYLCMCNAGFTAPPTQGTCTDVDECAMGTPCGARATLCTNTVGSYACTCMPGFSAPAAGGACADINECTLGLCGAGVTACMNSAGSFTCTCAAGYTGGAGSPCRDLDECQTGSPCGAGLGTCANRPGTYACTCNAGYSAPAMGGRCMDINECTAGTDDCDDAPDACGNTTGSFTCTCPTGFTGTTRGSSGCQWSDPSLLSLVPSVGTLSPVFNGATTTYTLTVPGGAANVRLTPTTAQPTRTTLRVAGTVVASGVASGPLTLDLAPVVVTVVVTTESGATRTYTLAIARQSPVYFKASNTASADYFGYPIALSADGTTLAIGAYGEDSDATTINGNQGSEGAANAGAVYVFRRTGAIWAQQAYIKASNASADDFFGYAVSLSADGSTLAVGAIWAGTSSIGNGAAYVYSRTGTTWSEQAALTATNPNSGDWFGGSVALSGDGATLVVGAPREDSTGTGVNSPLGANNSASEAGAAYVFARAGTVWTQQAYLKASNTDQEAAFGSSVSLSTNGNTLAIGSPGEDSGIVGNQSDTSAYFAGAAYVFTRTGTTWTQQVYLKASNVASGDRFGTSVSLAASGNALAVGAPLEDSNATGIQGNQASDAALDSGAVYVFARAGATWSQEAYLKASNTGAGDHFGASVAYSADGTRLAVGADNEDSMSSGIGGNQADNGAAESGAVYVYSRAGTTWSQLHYVKASNPAVSDYFGGACALTTDGTTLGVGAFGEDSAAVGVGGNQADDSASLAGAVYLY